MAGSCCVLIAAFACVRVEAAGPELAIPAADEQAAAPVKDMPRASNAQMRTGNPLWGIPLEQLSATRDRPIFSPSRRPPPVDAPPPTVAAAPEVVEPSPPERPALSLLGTVVNGERGLAIFLESGSTTPLRVRTGADYQGWTLRHVEARSATLQKGGQLVVLYFAQQSPGQSIIPVATTIAEMPSTQTAPPLAQSGPPFLSPESRLLRMHQRQRSGRRPL
ncbi:hypothetical protein ACQR1B_25800 [Bradyrhizobium oligotrophicum]